MAIRFRRSIKIAPGVRLNISKSGVSTSIGGRGARVTMGHGKTRTTVGVPGTGLSWTQVSSKSRRAAKQPLASAPPRSGMGIGGRLIWGVLAAVVVIIVLKSV